MFMFRLKLYLCIATTSMKHATSLQHKKIIMLCEKGISKIFKNSTFSIPHVVKMEILQMK